MKANVEYLGKYLKRPPIGETRIKEYDGSFVTYEYLDHYTDTKDVMRLPVLDFISKLLYHIPDKNFRNIRYYGFLANRVRGKLLPIVYKLLKNRPSFNTKVYISWQSMIQLSFHYNPLQCPVCKTIMVLQSIVFPVPYSLIALHQQIALGYFPLV